MYEEDQRVRMTQPINFSELTKGDSVREIRVAEYLKTGKVVTGKDHYHVAMIFQHGRDTVASSMAVKMMRKAIELDTTVNKWLLAAAIDRDLMRRGQPQIYGTQYVRGDANTKWTRYKIDSTKVTDEDRKYYGVETLAEQKIKERSLNLLPASGLYTSSKAVSVAVKQIRREHKKGMASAYNTSESAINALGYQLMKEKMLEDALAIFKLNTELYPNGFNTFDSLGECLFLLNRKEEGLKAYKRSLELNPKNEHARKVLDDAK